MDNNQNDPQNDVVFEEVVSRACGLDVHKETIVATVAGTGIVTETRTFGATTRALTELLRWLLSLGVTHIAMESTGVYWKPVMNILEEGHFSILVVNARHIKYVPGHKTDKKDSAWICKLLRAGLLKASFIPAREWRDLRDLTRYRRKLVQRLAAENNRFIRIFEDANMKLTSVFSDIRGKTCTAVIDAVLSGVTDPIELASLCTHWRLKNSREAIAEAVEGNLTEHHKFMIDKIRTSMSNIADQIAQLDAEIERRMQPYNEEITRLCEIPGMNRTSVKELLAEIGVDMSTFPNAEHLNSWAGLAPGNNESAGKRKSSHTNHGNKATKAIMTECAWCATRTKGTYFAARYRLMARKGKKRALVAIGANMLTVVYHMLKYGTHYQELGESFIEETRNKKNKTNSQSHESEKSSGEGLPGQQSA